LLFLAVIGGGIVWYLTAKTKQALEEMAASAVPLVPGAPGSTAGAPGPSSGTCSKAAACCKAITAKSGANPQAAAACDAVTQLGDAACAQYYRTYQQSAKLLGVQCD